MKKCQGLFVGCLFFVSGCQGVISKTPLSINAGLPTLKVEAAVLDCSVRLHMSLTNNTGSAMLLDRRALPWAENFSGIRLVIYRSDEEQELIKRIVGVDHPDGEMNLQPGQSISGSMTVNDSYPDLNDALRISDLQLRWEYVIRLSTGDSRRVEKGAFELNKCHPPRGIGDPEHASGTGAAKPERHGVPPNGHVLMHTIAGCDDAPASSRGRCRRKSLERWRRLRFRALAGAECGDELIQKLGYLVAKGCIVCQDETNNPGVTTWQ